MTLGGPSDTSKLGGHSNPLTLGLQESPSMSGFPPQSQIGHCPSFPIPKKTCLLGFKISIEIISVCQTFPQRKTSRRFPEGRLWSLSTVRTTNTTPSYPTFELSSDAPASEAWISSFWSSSVLLWLGCTLDSFILPNSTPNCCNLFPFPLCLFHSLARLLPPYQHNGYHYYPLILCLPELI